MQSDTFGADSYGFVRTAIDVDESKRITTIYVGPDKADYCTVTEVYGEFGLTTYFIQRCLFVEELALWDWELLMIAQRDYDEDTQ